MSKFTKYSIGLKYLSGLLPLKTIISKDYYLQRLLHFRTIASRDYCLSVLIQTSQDSYLSGLLQYLWRLSTFRTITFQNCYNSGLLQLRTIKRRTITFQDYYNSGLLPFRTITTQDYYTQDY